MKRGLFFALLLGVFAMPLTSAFWGSIEFAVRDLIEMMRQLLGPILEILVGDYTTSEFFFAKVLLMIIVFTLVHFALKNVPSIKDQKAVVNVVSIAVTILSVRYIQDNDFFNLILLPYGVLGVTLATIVPFLIYFYFVHHAQFGPVGRRLAWMFFTIVFCCLWWLRSNEIGAIGNQVYGWTLAAVALAFIFDRNIHAYFSLHDLHVFKRQANAREIIKLQNELLAMEGNWSAEAQKRRKDIAKQLEKLGTDA